MHIYKVMTLQKLRINLIYTIIGPVHNELLGYVCLRPLSKCHIYINAYKLGIKIDIDFIFNIDYLYQSQINLQLKKYT